MNIKMHEKVRDAIREHLPELQAAELREYLERIPELEKENTHLHHMLKSKQENLDEIRKVNEHLADTLQTNERKHQELEEREAALVEREIKHKLLVAKADHEKQRVEDHQKMVELIFRNTQVRESWTGSKPTFIPHHTDGYNNTQGGYVEHHTTSNDVTREEQ